MHSKYYYSLAYLWEWVVKNGRLCEKFHVPNELRILSAIKLINWQLIKSIGNHETPHQQNFVSKRG
jgi:hypothetical protein